MNDNVKKSYDALRYATHKKLVSWAEMVAEDYAGEDRLDYVCEAAGDSFVYTWEQDVIAMFASSAAEEEAEDMDGKGNNAVIAYCSLREYLGRAMANLPALGVLDAIPNAIESAGGAYFSTEIPTLEKSSATCEAKDVAQYSIDSMGMEYYTAQVWRYRYAYLAVVIDTAFGHNAWIDSVVYEDEDDARGRADGLAETLAEREREFQSASNAHAEFIDICAPDFLQDHRDMVGIPLALAMVWQHDSDANMVAALQEALRDEVNATREDINEDGLDMLESSLSHAEWTGVCETIQGDWDEYVRESRELQDAELTTNDVAEDCDIVVWFRVTSGDA